jgi:hypothetical protein
VKRWIGNILAMAVALLVGVMTIFASMRYLKIPQIPLDWIVLVCSALTTAVIAFFVTWGHFQADPLPRDD